MGPLAFGIVLLGLTCSLAQVQDPVAENTNSSAKPKSSDLEFVYLGRGDASGFRAQSLYYVSTSASNWASAFEVCSTKYGGHLVAIDTYKEDGIINGFLVGQRLDRVWTAGAYDTFSNGWIWTNPPYYQTIYHYDARWKNGEPSESNEYTRLAVVKTGFKSAWESLTEYEYMKSICEIE